MELLTWVFMAYGMSQILVYGSIFQSQRDLIHNIANNEQTFKFIKPLFVFLSGLISCMMCTSTWVGFFISFFYSPSSSLLNIDNFMSIFFDGMLASGSVWAINTIIEYYEK